MDWHIYKENIMLCEIETNILLNNIEIFSPNPGTFHHLPPQDKKKMILFGYFLANEGKIKERSYFSLQTAERRHIPFTTTELRTSTQPRKDREHEKLQQDFKAFMWPCHAKGRACVE